MVRRQQCGFTLIELMVVTLILAILTSIAVPVFLGARNRERAKRCKAGDSTACELLKRPGIWSLPTPSPVSGCDDHGNRLYYDEVVGERHLVSVVPDRGCER